MKEDANNSECESIPDTALNSYHYYIQKSRHRIYKNG